MIRDLMESRKITTEGGRIIRFGLVGVCATLVYILVSIIANENLRIAPVPTSILAQASSFAVSYFGHTVYSFRVKSDHSLFLWRFALITGLTFVLATSMTWLIADVGRLSPRIAVAVVAVLIPLVSYLCNRFWVFAPGLVSSPKLFEESRRGAKPRRR
jgi:putative flippase GtrA